MDIRNKAADVLIMIYLCICMSNAYIRDTHYLKLKHEISKRHSPLDNSQLCKAFGCVNGYCKESELQKFRIVCECFPGYEGKLCNRLQCPFPCGQHGKCHRNGPIVYCKCDEGFYGRSCNTSAKTLSLLTPDKKATQGALIHATIERIIMGPNGKLKPTGKIFPIQGGGSGWFGHASQDMKFSEFHSHAAVDMAVEADVCAPGFKCYHGHCDREALSFGMFQCICKTNYTGLFCEKRCTLQCQNGGSCMVMEDGHQYCSCPFDVTGYLCEKPLLIG